LCCAFESVTEAPFGSVTAAEDRCDFTDRGARGRRSKSLIENGRRPGLRRRQASDRPVAGWALSLIACGGLTLSLACNSDEHLPTLDASRAGAGPNAGGSGAVAGSSGEGGSAITGVSGAAGSGGSGEPVPECIPRQACQRLCSAVGDDPSRCGLGNASQCGCICEDRFNSPCPDELDALVACIGDAPSIDCSARGRVFPGCEDQSFALEICDFRAREQLCASSYPACTSYCRGTQLAFCPLGPESLSSCLCGCEASLVTACSASFDAFMTCSAGAPTFTCDGAGHPQAASCSSEWQTLSSCMDGLVAGHADAGP
jgi:hypothetical protein